MTGGNREKSYVSCPLDCLGDLTLVPGAISGNSPWYYFAPFRNKRTERPRILVVNSYLLVSAKTADLSALKCSLLLKTGSS